MERQTRWIEDKKLAMRTYLILMFVTGIVVSFLIPTWQTPDENAHLDMIGMSLKNENMEEFLRKDMPMDANRIRCQYNEKLNIEEWKEAMTQKPSYKRFSCTPKGMNLSVIKYLPAALGIVLGTLLYLPTFWVLQLAELFSLLFYVGICGLALKLMPVKKEVMALFMSFPMVLQQASSINYDSVLLPLCFLYVSYIFYMRYEKECLGWKEVAITLLLLLWISYIKIPYIFLGLLVFVLPREKICLKIGKREIDGTFIKKWRIIFTIVLVLLSVGVIYVIRDNYWVRLVAGMILEWKRTLYLFKATFQVWGQYLVTSSVGQFGYLESAIPFVYVIVSYLLVIAMSIFDEEEKQFQLQWKTRVYIWGVFIILCVFIVMSMVNHTITITCFGEETTNITYNVREMLYKIPYVGGLQGRYFLPFLALPFLALPVIKKEIQWKMWLIPIYQIVTMGVTIMVLYKRYWIG